MSPSSAAPRRSAPTLIAIDGRSGAGKSTLALELVTRLRRHHHVSLFHLEDLYPGWDGLATAIDVFAVEVLPELAAGRDATWRAWDWTGDCPGERRRTPAADVVVLEGVGVASAAARPLLDAVVWIDEDDDVRRARALDRDGDTYRPHWDRWAAQEELWLADDDVRSAADVVVRRSDGGSAVEATEAALLHLPGLHDVLRPEVVAARSLVQRVDEIRLTGPVAAADVFERLGAHHAPHAALLEASNPEAEDAGGRNRFSIIALADHGAAGPDGVGAPDRAAGAGAGAGADHPIPEPFRAPGTGCGRTVVEHRAAGDGQDADAQPRTLVRVGAATANVPGPFTEWLARWWDPAEDAGARRLTGPGALGYLSSGCNFQLGWTGWLGYELKREVGGSSVAGSLPDALLFRTRRAVVIDHHEARAWTLQEESARSDPAHGRLGDSSTDFDAASPAWSTTVRHALRASTGAAGIPPTPHSVPVFSCRDDAAGYQAKVRAAQAEIRDGNSYEVCLTTRLEARAKDWEPWQAYRQLRRTNPAPFAAYLRADGVALAGTSPERFLRIDADGWMRAEPIKGTRRRSADPEHDAALRRDLESSPKDRAENIMIVDLLRNDLVRSAAPETLSVPRLCAIESYASVHQMVSTIEARLRPAASRAEAVMAAFPPGSMTGAPKISTMAILDRLEEGHARGLYSGGIGYFADSGACDLSVVIRSLVMTADESDDGAWSLSLGVGGAVTADSDPADEWDEVRTKAFGVLNALGAEFPDA
ncbi:chorismate-binding protein [Zhihengliuella sp.]|uniref:chorismate-binding protein n=1 Tax=Zhihengliuella sp. TaxID=1954483 RepID=UPI002811F452|nr:chorismate-binding protein [Zhihengliuella sp.]